MEASTRTLRSRKVASSSSGEKPKVEKVDKKPKKDTNGVVAAPKKAAGRGKRSTKEKNPEDAPTEKKNKVDDKESQGDSDDSLSSLSIYEFKANTIQGKTISLNKYKGHVCIIVNVASKCGHTTSNYKELVELYDKYSGPKGLKILAFPCNQFGKQEPGDNDKICEFAAKKNVKFDMFEKINVNGKDAHPLWNYLTSQKEGPKGAKIDWNFTKFLINKNGEVVERFKPTVKPLVLVKELEKLW